MKSAPYSFPKELFEKVKKYFSIVESEQESDFDGIHLWNETEMSAKFSGSCHGQWYENSYSFDYNLLAELTLDEVEIKAKEEVEFRKKKKAKEEEEKAKQKEKEQEEKDRAEYEKLKNRFEPK